MRRCLPHLVFTAAVTAAMSLSLPAFAQGGNCPPGSWFCTEVDAEAGPGPQAPRHPPAAAPADDVDDDAPPAPPGAHRGPPQGPPPPVVVYQPAPAPPAHVVIVSPGYHRIPPPEFPPPPVYRWHPEWGLNLRAEGMAFMRSGAAGNAGMGGVGASLRYRPIPHFALEAGIDFLGGNDFNGFERVETPFTMNGLLYFNPRSRVQLYAIGGIHFSHADVHSDSSSPLLEREAGGGYGASYTYFGGQGGGGLEIRASRRVALDIDVVGFLRKRTDDGPKPEFVDWHTDQSTNTSTGALIRGGLTFWW